MTTSRRALIVVRLSVLTDATTSPERQLTLCTQAAERDLCTVVGVARDLDVSASRIPPHKRKELGIWLTKRCDEWDVLYVLKLDRLVRSVADLSYLIKWAQDHGKSIVSATEPFDLTSPMGRAMAQLIGVFAELEASYTRERVEGFRAFIRESNRWPGGPIGYGYQAVDNPAGKGKILTPYPPAVAVLNEICDRIIAGEASLQICRDLNARGEPTPRDVQRSLNGHELKGHQWEVTMFHNMLRSPTLQGVKQSNGEVVLGKDKTPLTFAPPVVDRAKQDHVIRILDSRRRPRAQTHGALLLSTVLRCAVCLQPMAANTDAPYKGGEKRHRYRCTSGVRDVPCGNLTVRTDALHPAFERLFFDTVGSNQVVNRVWVPASDPSIELADTTTRRNLLRADRSLGLYTSEGDQTWYRETMMALDARINELQRQSPVEAHWSETATDDTLGDVWCRSDDKQRRTLLLEQGFTAYVDCRERTLLITRDGDKYPHFRTASARTTTY